MKRVAEYVGTKHHSIELGSDSLIEYLLTPMRARDLPGVGELETSLYLLFKEMKKTQQLHFQANPQMKYSQDIHGSIKRSF